jgi:CRISPR-associated exonuclease Cas4
MLDDNPLITVTDLKQYTYCPRVLYYERCLPHVRPRTYMMDAGKEAHEDEHERAVRRVIARYDVPEGERRFNVQLKSAALGLWGILDEVVLTPDGGAIPVDYKLASKVGSHHHIQLTAYALLLESEMSRRVERGFIYLISLHKPVPVVITPRLRERTQAALVAIRMMIENEQMPPPLEQTGPCSACEFRRFCNDV